MSENSKIEWTDHTFNPWIGCTKVDELCAHCYAEQATPTRVARKKGVELWGKGKARQRTSENNWKEPVSWNKRESYECLSCGWRGYHNGICPCPNPNCDADEPCLTSQRIFCASLADWLDEEVPIEWLADLLKLIHDTPNLTWQLVTKRPENWRTQLINVVAWLIESNLASGIKEPSPLDTWIRLWLHDYPPDNVWIGTSVGTQKSADTRIPELLKIPAKVRFLSCEPLLEQVDLKLRRQPTDADYDGWSEDGPIDFIYREIHWIIGGGESGPNARPGHPDWARSLRDQCVAASVPFFFKQWGEWLPGEEHYQGPEWMFQNGAIVDSHEFPDLNQNPPGWFYDSYNCVVFKKVGKKAAGRLLDGREWNEFPEV